VRPPSSPLPPLKRNSPILVFQLPSRSAFPHFQAQPSAHSLPPTDVVKSRIQNAELPPKGANYIVNTFKEIYAREGAKAFVAGLTPSCASSRDSPFVSSSSTDLSSRVAVLRACVFDSFLFSFSFADLSSFTEFPLPLLPYVALLSSFSERR
jgi:hypothetical protein